MKESSLSQRSLCNAGTSIITPQGYYVDDADVEAFDKAFLPKEKLRLPGQIF